MKINIDGEEFEVSLNTRYHSSSVVKWFEECCNKILIEDELPEKYPEPVLMCFNLREIYTKKVSWCLLSKAWIDKLARKLEGKKCIELYAGLGRISHHLQKRGIDITPYDDKSWELNSNKPACEVITMGAYDAMKSKRNEKIDYVLMSWIPYDRWDEPNLKNKDCVKVAREIKCHHPETKMIVIGEDYGGCNANDVFFDMLHEYYIDHKINRVFQRWDGIHDNIGFYKPY